MERIKFTTEGIEVRTTAGPRSVVAHCAGGLACHESVTDADYYTITHIASGLAILSYLTKAEARKAIRAALAVEGADWTKTWDEIKADQRPYKLSKQAMRRACPGYIE